MRNNGESWTNQVLQMESELWLLEHQFVAMADLNVGVRKKSDRVIEGAKENEKNEEKMMETKKDKKKVGNMKKKQEKQK